MKVGMKRSFVLTTLAIGSLLMISACGENSTTREDSKIYFKETLASIGRIETVAKYFDVLPESISKITDDPIAIKMHRLVQEKYSKRSCSLFEETVSDSRPFGKLVLVGRGKDDLEPGEELCPVTVSIDSSAGRASLLRKVSFHANTPEFKEFDQNLNYLSTELRLPSSYQTDLNLKMTLSGTLFHEVGQTKINAEASVVKSGNGDQMITQSKMVFKLENQKSSYQSFTVEFQIESERVGQGDQSKETKVKYSLDNIEFTKEEGEKYWAQISWLFS